MKRDTHTEIQNTNFMIGADVPTDNKIEVDQISNEDKEKLTSVINNLDPSMINLQIFRLSKKYKFDKLVYGIDFTNGFIIPISEKQKNVFYFNMVKQSNKKQEPILESNWVRARDY